MPTPYNTLYYPPADTLPYNGLPSIEDIELGEAINAKPDNGQWIVRVQEHFIIKYGWGVRPLEGFNMLFVSMETDVPIPRVYAIYQNRDSTGRTCSYIIMKYIEGQPLNQCWASLSSGMKESIASQLRASLDQLRSLNQPGYFGSINHGPLHHPFFEGVEDPRINGPFGSINDLTEALVLKLEHENGAERVAYCRRVLPRVLRADGRVTFTHGNLRPKNVMLKPDGRVVILDWLWAGWYPSYWEYAMAILGCDMDTDFHAWVPSFLDEYPNQCLWLATIRRFLPR
jgi:serine/threonine protein kinase